MPDLQPADVNGHIADWLADRSDWLQEAALRLLTMGHLSPDDIRDLVELLQTGAGGEGPTQRVFPGFTPGSAESAGAAEELRLTSIGDVRGIENLSPKTPLRFGPKQLVVVYGRNGSGKSGYVRILRKACGKPHAAGLMPNVFARVPRDRGCTIEFSLGGNPTAVAWSADGDPVAQLGAVDVFDTTLGRVYLESDTEATYVPPSIAFFERLAQASQAVGTVLEKEKNGLATHLPALPPEFSNTDAGKVYRSLGVQAAAAIAPILVWDSPDIDRLNQLERLLATDDPTTLSQQKRRTCSELAKLRDSLARACESVSPETCGRLADLKRVAAARRQEAYVAAQAVAGAAVLPGVGTETWRRLWEAARQYSLEVAYPNTQYPCVAQDAHCVLCHQPLSADARARLTRFEAHIRGRFEADASRAEKERDHWLESLPSRPDDEALQTVCRAAGLNDEGWFTSIKAVWDAIEETVKKLSDLSADVVPGGLDQREIAVFQKMTCLHDTLMAEADRLDDNARKFDRVAATAERLELLARQWTSQQAESIKVEILRLGQVAKYDEWIAQTNTGSISREAGLVAESLITAAYVERFNCELQALGAGHISVELAKTRTERGRAKHRIRLRGVVGGQTVSPDQVLSEGEQRVVMLAAFLADVTGKSQPSPFVFDDPISSLDQVYEEMTAQRLIELSRDRQVIVFTHRLSLLGFLDTARPEALCITLEPWGSGQPAEVPLFATRVDRVLNRLRNERIPRAANEYERGGNDAYYPAGKSICTDLRIVIERLIENDLLGDIVQRHRCELHTKDKLSHLTKVSIDDCRLLEGLMTKYSAFEHSQSPEAPVDIPPPDVIAADVDSLLRWQDDFSHRAIPA